MGHDVTTMVPTRINDRWEILLPDHRAARTEWPVWERERMASMFEHLRPGMLVYDVGSEEGDLPALFHSWTAVESRPSGVVLFEPNPLVWPNIRTIWEANRFPPPAGWFVGFASDQTCRRPDRVEAIIAADPIGGWPACAYGPVIGDHGFRNVCERAHDTPQVRLDDYAAEGPAPHAITMDVEGAELVVLRGAERLLREARPLVWVSVHPEFSVAMYDLTDGDLHAFMADVGYRGTHLATDHEEHWFFVPD